MFSSSLLWTYFIHRYSFLSSQILTDTSSKKENRVSASISSNFHRTGKIVGEIATPYASNFRHRVFAIKMRRFDNLLTAVGGKHDLIDNFSSWNRRKSSTSVAYAYRFRHFPIRFRPKWTDCRMRGRSDARNFRLFGFCKRRARVRLRSPDDGSTREYFRRPRIPFEIWSHIFLKYP